MNPERRAAMLFFQQRIEAQLNNIERIVGPHYKLSLICRNTGPGDKDILLTSDDWEKVVACIQVMINRPDTQL